MSYILNSSNALDWFSYLAAIFVVLPVEPCHLYLTVKKMFSSPSASCIEYLLLIFDALERMLCLRLRISLVAFVK